MPSQHRSRVSPVPVACRSLAVAFLLSLGATGDLRADPGAAEAGVPSRASAVDGKGQGPSDALNVALSDHDFSKHPRLLQRILASPYGYFRFISRPFAQAVCEHFQRELEIMTLVNLHGDAHLENYSVTDRQRGLADFDEAAAGPPVLDLARFGVSIHLASRAMGVAEQADAIFATFIAGYRDGLRDGDRVPPEPALAAEIRAGFTEGRHAMLAKAEALMRPIEISRQDFERAAQQYRAQMKEEHPRLPAHFFEVKRVGALKLGIGSAFREKYLMRIEGATKAPEDDLILEAKAIRDLVGVDCIQRPRKAISRVAVAQARLSFEAPRYVGYVVLHPYLGFERRERFWVFAWDDQYAELSVPGSFRTAQDLFDVARDVGVQLGRGHPKGVADPYETMLRRALLASVGRFEADVAAAVRQLTRRTIAAWERLRFQAGVAPGLPAPASAVTPTQ